MLSVDMCWTDPPMRLWLIDTGERRAIEVAPGAGVKDLVVVTATALELRADQVELVFSDVIMPIGVSLASLGVYPDAEYRAIERAPKRAPERAPELEEVVEAPEPLWRAVLCALVGDRSTVVWCAIIVVSLGGIALSAYGFHTIDPGCNEPRCDAGGVLLCCATDRFGMTCIGRPDLADLSCAAWRAADRRCAARRSVDRALADTADTADALALTRRSAGDAYRCTYSNGTVTVTEGADEVLVDGPWSARSSLCIGGITTFGMCAVLAIMAVTANIEAVAREVGRARARR